MGTNKSQEKSPAQLEVEILKKPEQAPVQPEVRRGEESKKKEEKN
jgi:hypothetical protein